MFKNAFTLYKPINTYKPISENIGTVDGPLVYMSYPWLLLSFIKIPFPTRMTVIKLANGDLWLHSPTAYDENLAEELQKIGRIAHLVSPNKIHYANIQAWKERFPDAVSWASPGVKERAESQNIEVQFDRELGALAPSEWADEILQTVLPGNFLDEVMFFHKKSKTLILTDTIQNYELDKVGQPYRFLIWLAKAYDPHGQMPVDLRATFGKNAPGVKEAVETVLSWQPERIIVSHGKCIEKDAEKALKWAFRWAM